MLSVRELLRRIDEFAPFEGAEEWDNVGLMVGGLDAAASRVAVALDPTAEAVALAAEKGCQVLLCHHPLIFHAIKKLDTGTEPGLAICEAIRRGVTVLAAHTNWDRAGRGVNMTLSDMLGLRDVETLDAVSGLGARGLLPEETRLESFMARVKEAWGLTRLDCYTSGGRAGGVRKVAVCGGSGAGLCRAAAEWGADLYITADMKYHELIGANDGGLAVAVADHGEMERASLPALCRLLAGAGDMDVIMLDAKALTPPIRI